jgi:hypothetical protein
MSSALLVRKVVWRADGLGDIAQLVEKAALLLGIKPDGLQGRTESLATIMNNEFQAISMVNSSQGVDRSCRQPRRSD